MPSLQGRQTLNSYATDNNNAKCYKETLRTNERVYPENPGEAWRVRKDWLSQEIAELRFKGCVGVTQGSDYLLLHNKLP